jgi:hypothetical protein
LVQSQRRSVVVVASNTEIEDAVRNAAQNVFLVNIWAHRYLADSIDIREISFMKYRYLFPYKFSE